MSKLKTIYNYVKYPHQNKYSVIIIELSKLLRQNQDSTAQQKVNSQLIDLAVCTENVNLAIYLHASLSNFRNIIKDQNYFVGKILEKTLSNKRLVLSGDFFHVKASSLSSKIGYIEIPQYFSKIEENISKGMILQEDLNKKLLKNESVDQNQVEKMIELRDTSLIAYSLNIFQLKFYKSDVQEQSYNQISKIKKNSIKLVQQLVDQFISNMLQFQINDCQIFMILFQFQIMISSIFEFLYLNQEQISQGLKTLELMNLKIYNTNPISNEMYEQEVQKQKQKLMQQLKLQLQKFKIDDQKINDFVRII